MDREAYVQVPVSQLVGRVLVRVPLFIDCFDHVISLAVKVSHLGADDLLILCVVSVAVCLAVEGLWHLYFLLLGLVEAYRDRFLEIRATLAILGVCLQLGAGAVPLISSRCGALDLAEAAVQQLAALVQIDIRVVVRVVEA